MPGYITGIRFYKGAGNTGTHVGYLWTSTGYAAGHRHLHRRDGHRLAAGNLRHARGHRRQHRLRRLVLRARRRLLRRQRLLRQLGGDSGPLTALSNTAGGGNGVYLYGTGGGFPTSSYNATNYWVDVVFNPGSVNTPPPTVTAQTPAPGATGVSTISPDLGHVQRADPARHDHVHAHGCRRATAWPGRSATTRRPTRQRFTPNTPLATVDQVHGDCQRGDRLLRQYRWPLR